MKKLIVISGGLGKLGQRYAETLLTEGYSVLCVDVKKPISSEDFKGEYFPCDICDEADVLRLNDHLHRLDYKIHGLINNASAQPAGFHEEIENYSIETFRKVIDVNLTGSFLLTRTVIPFMKKQHGGSIINIASIQGVVAPTFEIYEGMNITSPLVYSATKAGMIHFCKWIAARYGKWQIRCNAISPGGVSDSQRGGEGFPKIYASKTPLGRMAESREIADIVSFLMSDQAKYITGQNIIVDGGWTIY